MVLGNPVASPFDDLAAPDLGGGGCRTRRDSPFAQITTTVAPMSPTPLYAPWTQPAAWLFNSPKSGVASNDEI
jgi:hypothetical protein